MRVVESVEVGGENTKENNDNNDSVDGVGMETGRGLP